MLAAERKRYSYEQDYTFESDHSPKRSAKHKQNIKFKTVLLIVIGFLLGLTVILRYAYIVESKYKLESMKKELVKIERENQILKVQLTELKSLDRIESIAKSELGMIEPNLDDIIFIKTPEFSIAMQNDTKYEKENEIPSFKPLKVISNISIINNILN